MPPIEREELRQKALTWSSTGVDQYGNYTRSSTSTEIKVRWTERQAEILDNQGNSISIDATVVTYELLKIGDYFWLGSQLDLETELPGTATGNMIIPLTNIFQIVSINKTPDLKNRNNRYENQLKRFSKKMPGTS